METPSQSHGPSPWATNLTLKTKLFSIFLIFSLLSSAFSVSGTTIGGYEEEKSTIFAVGLSEDLTISGGFGQNFGKVNEVLLDETLIISNQDKYQNFAQAVSHIQSQKAMMERVLPASRLRNHSEDLFGADSQVTITEFLEIITDSMYDGGAKTPSLPSIPLVFATTSDQELLQMVSMPVQTNEDSPPLFDDSGPPQIMSKFNINNSFESSLANAITLPNHYETPYFLEKIDSIEDFSLESILIPVNIFDTKETIIVISVPLVLYILLFAEGVVPGIPPPKVPRTARFYFIFIFLVFTTFSTPSAPNSSPFGRYPSVTPSV